MSDDLFFNGINADTGEYLLPPIKADLFIRMIGDRTPNLEELMELNYWLDTIRQGPYTIAAGHDPMYLDQAGWGVIFPYNCDPTIVNALRPLLDWRKNQAGIYYKEYRGAQGYLPGDTKNAWLKREPRKIGPGPAESKNIPYYLLIVGTAEQIPFNFQIQLDVQYAVGRICFETPDEYANYARSIVQAEQQQFRLPKRATFFGVSNPDDRSTQLSLENLISPLAERFSDEHFYDPVPWQVQKVFKDESTKAELVHLLHNSKPAALLFTASHGMGFSNSNPQRQLCNQGALLCQDWPGPFMWGRNSIPENFYFSGNDLSESANVWGSIVFLFACYSAGTPQWDEFLEKPLPEGKEIASHPFITSLPQKLLSHPNGGALAVIGHVDRAWSYSFYWEGAGQQLGVFENTLRRLSQGYPIGHALEFFNERYAELSTDLSDMLQYAKLMKSAPHPFELANLWTANNDAKNFILFGDPAARLMV